MVNVKKQLKDTISHIISGNRHNKAQISREPIPLTNDNYRLQENLARRERREAELGLALPILQATAPDIQTFYDGFMDILKRLKIYEIHVWVKVNPAIAEITDWDGFLDELVNVTIPEGNEPRKYLRDTAIQALLDITWNCYINQSYNPWVDNYIEQGNVLKRPKNDNDNIVDIPEAREALGFEGPFNRLDYRAIRVMADQLVMFACKARGIDTAAGQSL